MNFPVVFHLGSVALPAHLVFEVLAYAVGFQYYRWLRRREGDHLELQDRWTLIVAAVVGAAIGSKLLHHLNSPSRLLEHWSDPTYLMGGKTIVGGLLGGLVAVELTKWKLGLVRRSGDLYALPLCLAIVIGRVGCLLTGIHDDTVGVTTASFLGMDLGDGLARHPTPLYEMVFAALLGVLLWRRGRRAHAEGELFALFLAGYLAFRFGCDFLKPYEPLLGLCAIQWACLLGIAHEVRVLVSMRRARMMETVG
ncbi:MAG: prolipoprotein diacylglyceryl transferase [Planctomycetes bacterium]|nr:prolipoprotein diacylglyceryl transferase [Planctomycetota bacterium]